MKRLACLALLVASLWGCTTINRVEVNQVVGRDPHASEPSFSGICREYPNLSMCEIKT